MNNEIILAFGKKIRKLRIEKGLSQEKLAELTGFHRTYISLIERGQRNIGLKNIAVFANFFGIHINELLKGI